MDPQNTKRAKTITLSFNDSDCIIIDDVSKENQYFPKNNLNGLCIDLTGGDSPLRVENPVMPSTKSPTMEVDILVMPSQPNPQKEQNNNILKTIELNMNISDFSTAVSVPSTSNKKNVPHDKVANKTDFNNNSSNIQPSCSKNLVPRNENLLEVMKKNLIENAEDFVCSLCFNFIIKRHGVTLKNCLHNFCRKCLIDKIYNKHDPKSGFVKCPMEIEKCDSNLDEKEVKELLGNNYEVFVDQIKYNIEQDLEAEERKIAENVPLLPILLNMNDLESIPNFEAFECSICFVQIEPGNGIVLQNCLHKFCKECLSGLIEAAEEFEVKCPHIENRLPCNEFLREREIRGLVSDEAFEKHLQKSLKLAEHANELTFHCRTPDCRNFVEIDENVENFKCLVCQRINCIKCKAIHEGKTCTEYQEEINPDLKSERLNNENFMSEDAIKKMIEKNEAMYCPRCNIPVMKISGCDFITCSACKLGICWVTRKPRNDLKKADGTVIEGCRCNQPPTNKRCHPKCGNCH